MRDLVKSLALLRTKTSAAGREEFETQKSHTLYTFLRLLFSHVVEQVSRGVSTVFFKNMIYKGARVHV